MVAVTGSNGHIGNVLARKLLERGEEVRALYRNPDKLESLEGLPVEKVPADITNLDSLIKAFNRAETVFHVAGMISILKKDFKKLNQCNLIGTQNVIQASLKAGVKKLVYTCSIDGIKGVPHGAVIDESSGFDPESKQGYGRSKAQAALDVIGAAKKEIHTVVLCPTVVMGPYDYRISNLGQLSLDFARRKIPAYSGGAFDFVDVRDVAEGHILAWEKGENGEAYILAGEHLSIPDLMKILEQETGVKKPLFKVPKWLLYFATFFTPIFYNITKKKPRFTRYSIRTLFSNSRVSSKKAEQELGYRPRTFIETIRDTIKWFQDNGIL